jgi:hypothetical protein
MRPGDLNTQGQGALGRAFAVAVVFSGGMYALAAALIGMI